MTMYNEDDTLFARTMHGVMKIIAHLLKRDRSKTWGEDCWKRRIATDGVNGKPVSVHIYEYFTQIAVTKPNKIEGAERGIFLVQIIFCLKEKNEKEISSHRWLFNAFGHILQLNIYRLWKGFDINSNVGDTCGEIVAFKGKYGQTLPNPLVAAQNVECKMSDILDKLSIYISVLPDPLLGTYVQAPSRAVFRLEAQRTEAPKRAVRMLLFILYSVVLLAFVRFVGSTAYMIIRLFAGE
ncbi:chitin synthase-domain-containing protein [Lactarius deliciosus]|nr:chitin synthase-domain-containing protein [Lactarius deliciosus]